MDRGQAMELLAPAGGPEQLEYAIRFGADAVYLGCERFGMRARATNFTLDTLPEAVAKAHAKGVKVHLACNVVMHQGDLDGLPAFLRVASAAGVDALIIGDMGAMAGRMSPLTPEAAVVRKLMEEQGMNGDTVPIMLCTFITCVVTAVLVYVYYKGWKVEKSTDTAGKEKLPAFSKSQAENLKHASKHAGWKALTRTGKTVMR